MALVTITLEDVDLNTGHYKVGFNIDESKVSDGQFTAAHLTGAYIMTQLSSPDFCQQVMDFAVAVVAANEGSSIANSEYLNGDITPQS